MPYTDYLRQGNAGMDTEKGKYPLISLTKQGKQTSFDRGISYSQSNVWYDKVKMHIQPAKLEVGQ